MSVILRGRRERLQIDNKKYSVVSFAAARGTSLQGSSALRAASEIAE